MIRLGFIARGVVWAIWRGAVSIGTTLIHLSAEAELRLAIVRQEMVVYYQPIIDLCTGRCVGAESLVRWHTRNGRVVSPELFIPLLEKAGLMTTITDLVIDKIGEDLGDIMASDKAMHVAINLCVEDMQNDRVLSILSRKLGSGAVRPQQIWLEMTERGFVDIVSASKMMQKAKELGYGTAIDDFGTGYSCLQYLQRLPVDVVKIDRSFVSSIGRGRAPDSVISHIIDMAKSLNLVTIAEGVETAEQAEFLLKHGVDMVQGWFYAKAMSRDEFLRFYWSRKDLAQPNHRLNIDGGRLALCGS